MKKLLKTKIYFLIISIIKIILQPEYVLATNESLRNMETVAGGQGSVGFNTASKSIYPIVANIVGAFLALLGTIFLILIVWAGYTWMTAGGDEQKLEKAKNTIYRSIIGLLIVAGAWAITAFVFKNVPM